MRLQILNFILKEKSPDFSAIAGAFIKAVHPTDLDAILQNLINEGYIYPLINGTGSYTLTPKGREYRLNLQNTVNQINQQNEINHKEKRTERNREILTGIIHFLVNTFLVLLAAFFAEYTDFFHTLISWFQ